MNLTMVECLVIAICAFMMGLSAGSLAGLRAHVKHKSEEGYRLRLWYWEVVGKTASQRRAEDKAGAEEAGADGGLHKWFHVLGSVALVTVCLLVTVLVLNYVGIVQIVGE